MPEAAKAIGPKPIDYAIRAIPSAWFKPDPRVYWTDMLASALVGWTAFVLSVSTTGATHVVCLLVAALALYRAVLFIHELTHLAPHELPAFRTTWNALVGIPLLLPSFLYEGVHTDHHRQRSYGTPADPEYVPFARRSPVLIALYAIGSLFVPLVVAVRFGVIAPLSWVLPPLRRLTIARFSALIINHRYVRRTPLYPAAIVEEAAAAAVVWLSILLWAAGVMPGAVFGWWFAVSATLSAMNAVRTLAAHLYDHDSSAAGSDAALTMVQQLLDTCTIAPRRGAAGLAGATWRELWAPVGLRYHALHHWIPSLPYHNLGRAHRLLQTTLGADGPYAATQHGAIAPVVIDLVRRARHRHTGS